MNIAIFSDTYFPEINGVSTSVMTLKKELEKHHHNVYIVTTNPYEDKVTFVDNVLRIPGKELKKIYGYRMAGVYSYKASKILRKLKLNIVHVNTEFGIGIFGNIFAKRNRLPIVYTYHTMLEDYTYYITKGRLNYAAKKLVGNLSKLYGVVVTELISPSQKTKQALRRYGINSYINIVPTGIELEKFSMDNVDINLVNELKEKYKLNGYKVVMYLGRVAKEKDIEVIIDGFKRLKESNDEKYKLVIVGDGPNLISLKDLVDEYKLNDEVVFVGRVKQEETPLYYHLSDIFCSASISETQGLTFLEAMAAGKLVLARYDKNLEETLIDGGTGYYFVNSDDFVEKINKIEALDDVEYYKMVETCLKQAEKFSSNRFYHNIMEVYERAIRKMW